MGDVTNLDARRESKKTTLEKIEAVFTESERLSITGRGNFGASQDHGGHIS